MMSYIVIFFGGIVYTLIGLLMNELVLDYMYDMIRKVKKIDERFVSRLYINVKGRTEREKNIKSVIMFIFWPITYIAVILKAEWEFGSIKKHVYYREAP